MSRSLVCTALHNSSVQRMRQMCVNLKREGGAGGKKKSSMTSQAQTAAGQLKPGALAESCPESAAQHGQKPYDIQAALISADDKSTTCRKPPQR